MLALTAPEMPLLQRPVAELTVLEMHFAAAREWDSSFYLFLWL